MQSSVGSSPIPSRSFLEELRDNEFRGGFVADHVRTRLALLVRTLREQRGWSQAELGRRMGKPQSVVSRLEDPDYGKLTLQTLFEVATAFGLPLYIDMPQWDEWFQLTSDMSGWNLQRDSFDVERLAATADLHETATSITQVLASWKLACTAGGTKEAKEAAVILHDIRGGGVGSTKPKVSRYSSETAASPKSIPSQTKTDVNSPFYREMDAEVRGRGSVQRRSIVTFAPAVHEYVREGA